ncbi:MAG: ribosome silencing factor [Propionibacteriaceae bacterium]|nr:ribosome silencing factor [Propionibacteriaceae bacterium]
MTASAESLAIAAQALSAAAEKLATDPLLIDVSDKLGIADLFVIVSGANPRQVGAIVEAIEDRLDQSGVLGWRREGERQDPWVLIDCFDTVIHVMEREARVVYALERLWKDCPLIEVPFSQG